MAMKIFIFTCTFETWALGDKKFPNPDRKSWVCVLANKNVAFFITVTNNELDQPANLNSACFSFEALDLKVEIVSNQSLVYIQDSMFFHLGI